MKKILVIDDDQSIQRRIKKALQLLGNPIELVSALTLKEARESFDKHKKELSLILLDACLENNKPDTIGLAKYFRDNFDGKIIAISSEYNDMLIQAGCDTGMFKEGAIRELPEIIGVEASTETKKKLLDISNNPFA